jgi:hypothetical protein
MTQGYIAPGTKRVDSLGAYVMTYYSGAWDYTCSAPMPRNQSAHVRILDAQG